MKLFFGFCLLCFLAGCENATSWNGSVFSVKGNEITTLSYDTTGEQTDVWVCEVTDVKEMADSFSSIVDLKWFGQGISNRHTVKCETGYSKVGFFRDMRSFLIPGFANCIKDEERYKVVSDLLYYPADMKAGQALNGGVIRITPRNDTFSVPYTRIVNRIVEAFDTCSTRAGDWSCFRISYDVEVMSNYSGKAIYGYHWIEWFNPEAGVVRSEFYKEGKLIGYSEIAAIRLAQPD